jgi:phosphatidylglycerol:prolipoprotein diacylglycerol transferase
MYPRLFDISTEISGLGHLVLPSYFAMVTMGFIMATLIIRRFAAQHGLDMRLITDFIIWMALWGLLGARLLHVIADGHFWDLPGSVIGGLEGGPAGVPGAGRGMGRSQGDLSSG